MWILADTYIGKKKQLVNWMESWISDNNAIVTKYEELYEDGKLDRINYWFAISGTDQSELYTIRRVERIK